jgi:acyl carrier protein
MHTPNIESKVIAFIKDTVHQENPIEIRTSTRFSDLGLDSMDIAQLLFEAEDTFGISFDMEKAANISSVGDIATYIANHHAITAA